MKRLIPILLLIFFSTPVMAVHPRFTAVCQSDEVHAFRYDEQLNGDTGKGDWTTDGTFSDWFFAFDGVNLTVDGELMLLFPSPPTVLIAAESSTNGLGGSLWTYVIHVELHKIAAAQVHGSTLFGGSIKARAVELDCVFE